MLLVLPKEEGFKVNLYLEMLVSLTRVDQFNDEQQLGMGISVSPCLIKENGDKQTSLKDITQELVKICGMDYLMIGSNETQINVYNKHFEIDQSLSFDQLLSVTEEYLKGNMFIEFNGNLRVCDLFIFALLFRDIVTSDNQTKLKHPNVYRWFRYVQSLDGVKQFLEKKQFPLMEKISLKEQTNQIYKYNLLQKYQLLQCKIVRSLKLNSSQINYKISRQIIIYKKHLTQVAIMISFLYQILNKRQIIYINKYLEINRFIIFNLFLVLILIYSFHYSLLQSIGSKKLSCKLIYIFRPFLHRFQIKGSNYLFQFWML